MWAAVHPTSLVGVLSFQRSGSWLAGSRPAPPPPKQARPHCSRLIHDSARDAEVGRCSVAVVACNFLACCCVVVSLVSLHPDISLFASPSLSICLFVCLFACLFVCPFVPVLPVFLWFDFSYALPAPFPSLLVSSFFESSASLLSLELSLPPPRHPRLPSIDAVDT